MPVGLWVVFGWMVLVVVTGIVFFTWGAWRGQFRNIEEAKYRMLEDKDPEPWPKHGNHAQKGASEEDAICH